MDRSVTPMAGEPKQFDQSDRASEGQDQPLNKHWCC
jgi:hypothetical protein